MDKVNLQPPKIVDPTTKQKKLEAWNVLPPDIKQTMEPYFNIDSNESSLFKGVPNTAEFDTIISRMSEK